MAGPLDRSARVSFGRGHDRQQMGAPPSWLTRPAALRSNGTPRAGRRTRPRDRSPRAPPGWPLARPPQRALSSSESWCSSGIVGGESVRAGRQDARIQAVSGNAEWLAVARISTQLAARDRRCSTRRCATTPSRTARRPKLRGYGRLRRCPHDARCGRAGGVRIAGRLAPACSEIAVVTARRQAALARRPQQACRGLALGRSHFDESERGSATPASRRCPWTIVSGCRSRRCAQSHCPSA